MKLRTEFRRFWYALFCAALPCMLLTACLFVLFYFLLKSELTLPLSYWFASLPTGLRAFTYILGALDMSDPLIFVARFFQPIYFIACIAAAFIGSRCLNSDERGLLELCYNIPVSRTTLFLRRYFGGLGVLLILNLLLLAETIVGYALIFIPNLTYITVYVVMFMRMAVVEGILFAIGILYSAIAHRSGRSTVWSVVTLLLLWSFAIIPAFSGKANAVIYAALPYHGIPELALQAGPYYSWLEGSILGAVFAICSLAALFVYRKKQFTLYD